MTFALAELADEAERLLRAGSRRYPDNALRPQTDQAREAAKLLVRLGRARVALVVDGAAVEYTLTQRVAP